LRRYAFAGLLLLIPVLFGCSVGRPSSGFINARLMDAYIPLSEGRILILNHWAAGFVIAPNVGVTNDHNLNLIPPDRVLARSRDYDLLFFRTDLSMTALAAAARPGEEVIAYGQGREDDLREAKGAVSGLDQSVAPRCPGCRIQRALVFDAEAGGGFSGGPVVDAESGAVLGIVFGYLDGKGEGGGRRMYAYDVALVIEEMHRLLDMRRP
jgi:S1-C subfamily serine protease